MSAPSFDAFLLDNGFTPAEISSLQAAGVGDFESLGNSTPESLKASGLKSIKARKLHALAIQNSTALKGSKIEASKQPTIGSEIEASNEPKVVAPGTEAMDRTTEIQAAAALPKHWQSKRPKTTKYDRHTSPASDTGPVLKGGYVEVFAVGGGTRWFYAAVDFLMALFLVLKNMGMPGAGQVCMFFIFLHFSLYSLACIFFVFKLPFLFLYFFFFVTLFFFPIFLFFDVSDSSSSSHCPNYMRLFLYLFSCTDCRSMGLHYELPLCRSLDQVHARRKRAAALHYRRRHGTPAVACLLESQDARRVLWEEGCLAAAPQSRRRSVAVSTKSTHAPWYARARSFH
jgi:hypothetical protein